MATIGLTQEHSDNMQYPRTQKDTGSSFVSTFISASFWYYMAPITVTALTDLAIKYCDFLTCLYLFVFGNYIEDYFGSENMMRIYLAGGVVNSIMCTIAGVGVFWRSALFVPVIGICMSRKIAPKSELAPGEEVDALDQAVKSDTALVWLGAIYIQRFIINPVGEIGLFIGLLTGVAFDALERKGYLNGFLLNKDASAESIGAENLTSHRIARKSDGIERKVQCGEELQDDAHHQPQTP